ncbi:hypothetical protein BDV93DRAFT_564780 [Ceratobasidium sp. AG-I]|nr:hypothetical protein BDV93DRAFT_564780 [Ceratobasidium sp. AG-I]
MDGDEAEEQGGSTPGETVDVGEEVVWCETWVAGVVFDPCLGGSPVGSAPALPSTQSAGTPLETSENVPIDDEALRNMNSTPARDQLPVPPFPVPRISELL